tara:strand:- start:482 stop:646 length:165 start_codon:yes stop_codon:yes gene_type:complete
MGIEEIVTFAFKGPSLRLYKEVVARFLEVIKLWAEMRFRKLIFYLYAQILCSTE